MMRNKGSLGARGSRLPVGVAAVLLALSLGSCREEALQRPTSSDGSAEMPAGLTPKQASMVLAKVGDDPITLGEFAATLERMDQFDRLRYRTPERRRELLEEMIKVELLAQEARRQGLSNDPEVQEALRQILRDAILRDARKGARGPAEFSEAEVRAYYDEHKEDYKEPERRRVGQIEMSNKAKAEKVLEEAKTANAAEWGKLVLANSLEYAGKTYSGPVETAGDLGLVGPPADKRGANPRVAEEVRAAVFELSEVGQVLGRLVEGQGKWHIIRLMGKTASHARSYAEAERTIRITMSQRDIAEREQVLEEELRKKFPVTIDESALADVEIPSTTQPNPEPSAEPPGHAH